MGRKGRGGKWGGREEEVSGQEEESRPIGGRRDKRGYEERKRKEKKKVKRERGRRKRNRREKGRKRKQMKKSREK